MMELLISIAILGTVAVGFMGALMAGYHGVRVAHDQTTAQSLTRTAMEDVATEPFPIDTDEEEVTTTGNFDVVVDAYYIDSDYVESEDPTQIQMVTVTVRYHDSLETIKTTQCVKAQQ